METIDACAMAGITWIAPWRDQFEQVPVAKAARAIRDAGLSVSSLCRGGFFPASTEGERRARIAENRRAVDEAAALGTDVLVLVCRGIEPLHPMFAADRSVVVTLGQANALAARLASPWVGVVVDVYHVWWDPQLGDAIEDAAPWTLGFHVNDWIVPLPDVLNGRGVM